MRIKTIEIKNLRSIKAATVELDDYTCLVGPNGAGKSTLLCALNIFFREIDNAATDLVYLTIEDFHHQDTTQPVEVTVTFVDLSADAQEDFKDYFRQGQLIVSAIAEFNLNTGKAEVKQYGQRLGMDAFRPFFKAYGDNEKASVLKDYFSGLREQFPEITIATTKDGMAESLNAYEAGKPGDCILIPSEDQFYGVSRGTNRLQKYLQWVYVPAVKDATEEQIENKNSALGKLLARTVRSKVNFDAAIKALLEDARKKYEQILGDNQVALDEISASLKARLTQWAHPDASLRLAWQQDPSKSVRVEDPLAKIIAGEGGFEGDLARFGHGFQRSYLLALLQELASIEDENTPRLILGCEEPELYQHPPQAKHLAFVLNKLAQANTQVVVTTHSPCFISGESFEKVRMFRQNSAEKLSTVKSLTHAEIADRYAAVVGQALPMPSAGMAKIHQALQSSLSDIFFTQRLILVEGFEDAAFIHTWLSLTDRIDAYRRTGCYIVPVNKKSEMIRALIIAQGLDIPTFSIFDADADCNENEKNFHERDNLALIKLLKGNEGNLFPDEIVWNTYYAIWPTDMAQMVEQDLIQSLGQGVYETVRNSAHNLYGNEAGIKKNTLLIKSKLALAWEAGGLSPTLDKLCDRLIQFGSANN